MSIQAKIEKLAADIKVYGDLMGDFSRGVARHQMMLNTHLEFVERKLGHVNQWEHERNKVQGMAHWSKQDV